MEDAVEPVTLIASALAAGALKGVGESASAAVKDAYAALKAAVRAKFAGQPSAELVLVEHENDPDTYERPLAKQVVQVGIDQDPRIVQLADVPLSARPFRAENGAVVVR